MNKKLQSIFCSLCCVICCTSTMAADITWNVTSGNWNNSANWSPAQVPGGDDQAIIAGTCTVIVDSVLSPISNLNVNGGGTIDFHIEPGGYLETTNVAAFFDVNAYIGGVFTQAYDQSSAFNWTRVNLVVTNGGTYQIQRWIRVADLVLLVDNSYAEFDQLQMSWAGSGLIVTLTNGATFRQVDPHAYGFGMNNGLWSILNVCGSSNTITMEEFEFGTGTGTVNFVMDNSGFSTINCTDVPLADNTTGETILTIDASGATESPTNTYVLFDGTSLSGTFTTTNFIGCTADVVYDYGADEIRLENFALPANGSVFMFF